MSTSKQIFCERVRSPFSSHNDSLIILKGFDQRRFENHRRLGTLPDVRHRKVACRLAVHLWEVFIRCKSSETIPRRVKGIEEEYIKGTRSGWEVFGICAFKVTVNHIIFVCKHLFCSHSRFWTWFVHRRNTRLLVKI